MSPFLQDINNFILDKKLSQIYVNHGGCGKAAEYFFKFFKDKKNLKIVGIKILNPKCFVRGGEHIKKQILKGTEIGMHHVVLLLKENDQIYCVDAAHGIIPLEYFIETYDPSLTFEKGYLNLKFLKYINKQNEKWNNTFCPERHSLLRKFFKELKENFNCLL